MSQPHVFMSLEAPPLVSSLIEGLLDAVWLVNAQNLRVVAANAAAGRLFQIDPLELTGRHAQELCASPEDMAFWQEVGEAYLGADPDSVQVPSIESETLVRRFDGLTIPVLRRVRHLNLGPGQSYFLVVLHDRSEQLQIEKQLQERMADLAALLDSGAEGLMVTDVAGRIRNVNQQFARLWSVPQELLLQRNDQALWAWMRQSTSDPASYERDLARIDHTTRFSITNIIKLQNGRVLERETLPQLSGGRLIGRVFSFRDITERVEAQRVIGNLSSVDTLTGLPNREVFSAQALAALSHAQSNPGSLAVMVINLDHFKQVNDTLGPGFGDGVLMEVAHRLKACIGPLDTLTRLGGDEFGMLIAQTDAQLAAAMGQRVLQAMLKPFALADYGFQLSCSIGVAMGPGEALGLESLLGRASLAMKSVKASGGSGVRLYQASGVHSAVQARAFNGLLLEHAMRRALVDQRFKLHYQPQVDLRTGRILGAEALLRWSDPELGAVSPLTFIPVAEQSGFMGELGEWVLHEAIQQAANWRTQGYTLVVSINVSAFQFNQPGFVHAVESALQRAQLPADCLELELKESILVQEGQEALERLKALSALGVRLSIDDFGTGYSSLGYLQRLPISRLKIDQSLLRGLPTESSDVSFVNSVITLGRALHLGIVAEGVETEVQRQFLEDAGCEQYQGFLFSPAIDAPRFTARLGPVSMTRSPSLTERSQ